MSVTTKQDGVKVLNSLNKLEGTVILPLSDIYSLKDDVMDKVFDATLKKSLETKGMLNPILVCTDFDFKQTDVRQFERRPVEEYITQRYRCLIGNNRYLYAVENGYTHIECFIVRTFNEVKKAHLLTQIEPRKM
jgi:hypothetical protein